MAQDFLNQAKLRFNTAKNAFREQEYAYSVRQSQEGTEMALKAALRLIGIDFPKWHDVGKILKEKSNKFPKNFAVKIPKLAEISKRLVSLREPAMYGDETSNIGPSQLFNKSDAKMIIEDIEYCIKVVENLF